MEEVYDFRGNNDCFMVKIEGESFSILPPPPIPSIPIAHDENNFSEYVPLPFYGNEETARWSFIEDTLRRISTSRNLKAQHVIEAIRSLGHQNEDFSALSVVLQDGMRDGDYLLPLLEDVVPKMAELAMSITELITRPIPLLKASVNCSLTLSQQQCASILANAFFCTFSEELRNDASRDHYNLINFSRIFSLECGENVSKLRCLFYYFYKITRQMPCGTVTFMRTSCPPPKWSEDDGALTLLTAHRKGFIEDSAGMTQMDFANKYIGGGVLNHGSVQEEIRFLTCPEMIVSCLFCERMLRNESIRIIGAETYSNYIGYASRFRWQSRPRPEVVPRDEFGRYKCELLAVDALCYRSYQSQFNSKLILRELNKAHSGFSVVTSVSVHTPIATGNWGCGAFNGDLQLKSMIQLLAASKAKRKLVYFTFGNAEFASYLNEIVQTLHQNNITIGTLYEWIQEYAFFHKLKIALFDFLWGRIRKQRKVTADNNGLLMLQPTRATENVSEPDKSARSSFPDVY